MSKQTTYIADIYSDKIYHWVMFMKYNNFGFLRRDSLSKPPSKVEHDQSKEAIEAYEYINDQITEDFGIAESFLTQKKLQKDVAILKLDFIISGNKMKRTEYRIKEIELSSLSEDKNQDEAMSLSKELSIVSKNLGAGIIDIKEYSIFQYLTAKNNSNGEQ